MLNFYYFASETKIIQTMKIRFVTFIIAAVIISSSACSQKVNTLSSVEKKDGWVLLFNGSDFSGWRQCNGTEMPKNWVIDTACIFAGVSNRSLLGIG
jgi:hypothetical protein